MPVCIFYQQGRCKFGGRCVILYLGLTSIANSPHNQIDARMSTQEPSPHPHLEEGETGLACWLGEVLRVLPVAAAHLEVRNTFVMMTFSF